MRNTEGVKHTHTHTHKNWKLSNLIYLTYLFPVLSSFNNFPNLCLAVAKPFFDFSLTNFVPSVEDVESKKKNYSLINRVVLGNTYRVDHGHVSANFN